MKELKYLGVVLDSKFCWKQHVLHLSNKCEKILLGLNKVARNSFGIKSNVSSLIYKQGIVPFICYGSQIWGSALKKKIYCLLRKIQRRILLRVISGYRMISYKAVFAISGFPPIDIFIIRNNEFKIATKNCTNKCLDGSLRVSELSHPSERFPLNLVNYRRNIENNFPVVCFTDGSKINTKVGLAFVIFQDFIEIGTRQFRIRDECSVFQAELLCIAQAVSWICNNEILSSNFLICCDSLSSLCALNNIYSQNKLMVKTHINLDFLRSRGVQLFFSFVRGHTGIYGNERADWLAKEATKLSDLVPMSIPRSYHKKVFKEKIISEGNNLYQISNNAHLTKEFFPSIQSRLKAKHFHPNFKLTQFLTGHGNFKAYLKHFNLSPTDQCSCSNVCEHIYCGPNANCVSEKISCECAEGYEGNPHDFLSGCVLANATEEENATEAPSNRSGFELHLEDKESHEMKDTTTTVTPEDQSNNSEFKNELENENEGSEKETVPTEAPFQLDLTNNKTKAPISEENVTTSEAPNEEENFHLVRPQDNANSEANEEKGEDISGRDMRNQTSDVPVPFDGCEYNNVTYDKGVTFEDGCEARCTCEGRGHVSCVPRCTVLSAGGPTCTEVQDPDDHCCKIMVCSFPGSTEKEQVEGLPIKVLSALAQNGTSVRVRLGLSMSRLPTMVGRDSLEVWYRESSDSDNDLSQWNKKLISQNELTEVQQGVFEFDINDLVPQTDYYIKVGRQSQSSSDFNMAEFSNTVNVKTFPAAVKTVFQGCFHHNQSYSLGEIFYQGCEHKCICREKGFIECQDRCEIYIDTVGYEGCDWVQSEEDPCCTIPMCNRRKIPLMPDGRVPFTGAPENMCVVDHNEIYRVGDIWESGDGCKTKICRCTLLANGSTSIQCQSECPPLAPNAHIPTARCPHPMLIKPDGPCSCPYVVCNETPRRVVQPPRPQCEYKGQRYDMGQEFHDGCIALCHCGQDLRVNCAPIECPYHFSAKFSNCLEWDIDPNFFPIPPQCCAPAKCKNDGSCMFGNTKFENFQVIPSELLQCGTGCVCVNGNVTCENRCPPIEDVPPVNLPCSPNLAFKGHADGDSCCLQWMCKEPLKTNYCMFQGMRYLVSEQWEVQKGNQQKLCSCHLNEMGSPEVECRGGCPQIPPRFLQPTEQCLRPTIVNPEDPLMCPYVVCNNTVSGQDLYNVNVVALNSTAVRVRFSLASILVGLIGHAELHFTTDPTLPPSQWHIQKFSRPKRLFDSPNIEYILNALRPNTTYFLQVKIIIDALQGGPQSELFKLKMPEEIVPTTTTTTTTTTVPPMMIIDPKAEAHIIDAKTVRISWRNFEPQEKKYIYALQLKYKLQNEAEDKWITTPMIHRDVTSYFLHDLEPSADYIVDVLFTPPKDVPTKIVSTKGIKFKTAEKMKEDYHLQVAVEDNKVEADKSSFSFAGIPEPVTKYVHVIKIMYKSSDGEQSYSFKVPKTNHIMLDHLKPGKKYLAQLELYLTNGQTLTSNEVEFITKPAKSDTNVSVSDNVISHESHINGKQAELLQSKDGTEEENRAYFIALVVVAVVAAVAAFGFILLLVLLVRRQASAKAPISRTPSESAYDNPTYKTYDGERPEDKTNGQTIQTTQA
ncbi:putative epidermal cell surface receptor [Trichonephila clavipes]|nr:putative epidermal cell surface receptor [Trichonephila clavipes]